MKFKEPKDTETILWTEHAKEKMRFYRLSERRLRNLLRNPEREEKGVAPGTAAIMQPAKSKKRKSEIWLMYQLIKTKKRKLRHPKSTKDVLKKTPKIRIISAWRYPGRSPVGKPPIPQDVIEDLRKL